MLRWLILSTLLVTNILALWLPEELEDYHLWRRGSPSVKTEDKDLLRRSFKSRPPPAAGRPGPPASISTTTNPECRKDIIILWDNSNSVGKGNFKDAVRPFLRTLIKDSSLNVGEDGTQIGIITFSTKNTTKPLVELGEIKNAEDLIAYINTLEYRNLQGVTTYTGKAFQLAAERFQKKSPLNYREDVPDVVMVITDGEPRVAGNQTAVEKEKQRADSYAKELKDRGVKVIGLAVKGTTTNKEESMKFVQEWASEDSFAEADVKHLKSTLKHLVAKACIDPGKCVCKSKIELLAYAPPHEETVNVSWPTPGAVTDKNNSCSPVSSNRPSAASHGTFGLGKNVITYPFSNGGATPQISNCFVEVTVAHCNCPSPQNIVAERLSGRNSGASVSWREPHPNCTATPSPSNPSTHSGMFTAGEHTVLYRYRVQNRFDLECPVRIEVPGEFCGDVAYDSGTHVCCCRSVHRKKNGDYKCCGQQYINSGKKMCCQGDIAITRPGPCPK